MRNTRFAASFAAALILLVAPLTASAKAATSIITISGGRLGWTIAVMDPQILEHSNVWLGNFLDSSKGTVKGPPHGLAAYEISFYVAFRNEYASKRYVMYYYPRDSSTQGYIYLPGHGEKYYYLNVGSILREGQDGKFNYADAKWENLIKRVIAEAGQR